MRICLIATLVVVATLVSLPILGAAAAPDPDQIASRAVITDMGQRAA